MSRATRRSSRTDGSVVPMKDGFAHGTRVLFGVLFTVVMIIFTQTAVAQTLTRIEIPSSYNPVGSGARALAMGGAFIAVADDATAASWNPGGLTQLERPEASVVGAYFYRVEDNTFGTNPEASGSESVSDIKLNYLSASYPFTLLQRNMVVSLNYQNLYDFNREWNFPLNLAEPGFALSQNVDVDQEGTLSAIGLAYAIQVTPQLSFGFTLNFWEDAIYDNEWKQTTRQSGFGTLAGNPFTFTSTAKEKFQFSGFNANLGVLWNATGKVTLGAVLKTPFEADLSRELNFRSDVTFPGAPGAGSMVLTSVSEDQELDMPMSYGIGIAYRPSDRFTLSAEVYRTDWDDFILKDAQGI